MIVSCDVRLTIEAEQGSHRDACEEFRGKHGVSAKGVLLGRKLTYCEGILEPGEQVQVCLPERFRRRRLVVSRTLPE